MTILKIAWMIFNIVNPIPIGSNPYKALFAYSVPPLQMHASPQVRSTLVAQAKRGQRARLIQAFLERRVLQECQATVSGFISAEVLTPQDAEDEVQVTVLWADQAAWQEWQDSPVRQAQQADLAPWLAALPSSRSHQVVMSA